MEFSRLVIPKPPRTASESVQKKESAFWKTYKSPIFLKSYAPITHIQFSPTSPHRYVVTSGTRLQIYSPKTNKVIKTISRFKDTARSGEIRTDGKLCIAGDEGGLVQVFDINSRAILRSIKAHKQAVHTTKFSPSGTQILTTSSDTTVRLFDLSTSTPLRTFTQHTDYVKCATFVPSSPSLIFSGGYDSTVRLWDSRIPDSEGSGQVWMGRHGKPVESVLVGETGTMALSAGGPMVRVWDLLGASTSKGSVVTEGEEEMLVDTGATFCVKAFSNHQKTITSLCWGEGEQGETRVLSAGLDGLVKVYDPQDNWKVKHTMRYGGQILTLAVSLNSSHLIAGLSDGSLSIRTRPSVRKSSLLAPPEPLSYDAILAGAGKGGVVFEGKEAMEGLPSSEKRLGNLRKKKLNIWDRMLKDFRYGDALDSVMKRDTDPALTFSLLSELIHRNGLEIALANRHDLSLEPILKFLIRNITNPRYCILASDVATVLIGLYTSTLGLSPLVDGLFAKLKKRVSEELEFETDLESIRGALEMVFAGSSQSRRKLV